MRCKLHVPNGKTSAKFLADARARAQKNTMRNAPSTYGKRLRPWSYGGDSDGGAAGCEDWAGSSPAEVLAASPSPLFTSTPKSTGRKPLGPPLSEATSSAVTLPLTAWLSASSAMAATSVRRPAPAKQSVSSRPSTLVQSYLALGQRGADPETCGRCGMTWTPGLASEERAHASHCALSALRSAAGGAAVPAPPRALKAFRICAGPNGSDFFCLPVVRADVAAALPIYDASATLTAPASLPAATRVVAVAVTELLARELGPNSHPFTVDRSGRGCGGGNAGEEGAAVPARYWLAVAGGHIVGALVTADVPNGAAFPLRVDVGGESIAPTMDRSQPTRASLGVAQVWTAPAWRRRGLARSLLDAARAHAVYGHSVPWREVAFSQPTRAGRAFATSYVAAAASAEPAPAVAPQVLVF